MSLIEKFAAVEIKVDARISERDKQFCERQQAAYTAALHGFQELTFFWEDMLSAQKALLGEPNSPPPAYNHYLVSGSDDGPKITIQRLRVHINTLHRRFIQQLADYFQSAYNIEIEEKKIISEFLLIPPPKSEKQALKEYLLWASSVQLHYEDIVIHILSCFDGRTPSEQSLQELCRRCNEAVWCNYTHKAKFERKYAIISLLNSFCSFRNDKEYWTFTNSMKAILPCAAHSETGVLNEYPTFFPSPPFDGTYGCNQLDFPGCEKLVQLRLFKNGRVDIRFSSEDYADQFINAYLGRDYQKSAGEVVAWKYQSQALRFSLEQRRMLNEKVVYLLDSQSCNQYDITGEDIFNAYTGIGGLHGLSQGDFSNYHEYSEQKKLFEIG